MASEELAESISNATFYFVELLGCHPFPNPPGEFLIDLKSKWFSNS
jgi:hypothetical protein